MDWRRGAPIVIGAAAIGYPIGLAYPRRTSYNVTSGDVVALMPAGMIGAVAASIPIIDQKAKDGSKYRALTAGLAVGLILGDLTLARRYDHTEAQAGLVTLGTVAGGLMGAGLSVVLQGNKSNRAFSAGLGTATAIAGLAVTEKYLLRTAPDAGYQAPGTQTRNGAGNGLQLELFGLALAASRVPGAHSLVSFSF